MRKSPEVIDISDAPELLRLAEEVRSSKTPRLLKRGDEPIAEIVPVRRRSRRRSPTAAEREAFRSSAGGWKDLVDTDKLVADIYESRRISSRPPIEP